MVHFLNPPPPCPKVNRFKKNLLFHEKKTKQKKAKAISADGLKVNLQNNLKKQGIQDETGRNRKKQKKMKKKTLKKTLNKEIVRNSKKR